MLLQKLFYVRWEKFFSYINQIELKTIPKLKNYI